MNRPRVMVVDDEPGMLHAIRRILERDVELRLYERPQQALAELAAFAPQLVLLDVRLPEQDGFATLQQIKRMAPSIDVVLMTGSVTDLDAKLTRSLREQAWFFLQKPFDRELLRTLVERWREQRRLSEQNRQHTARLERELQQARAFQAGMMPGAAATLGGVALAGAWLPCDELGGDFYDWAAAGPAAATVLVADVSGHGVSAALLTGFVKAAFWGAHDDGHRPLAVVRRLAEGLRAMDEGCFVTLACARIDAAAGIVDLVSAGHPYAAIVGGGTVRHLDSTGPLVSPAFADAEWRELRLPLRAGDALWLYTDGIDEAVDAGGAMFGQAGVTRALADADAPAALIAAMRAFVGSRPLRDDCTAVCARIGG